MKSCVETTYMPHRPQVKIYKFGLYLLPVKEKDNWLDQWLDQWLPVYGSGNCLVWLLRVEVSGKCLDEIYC